MRYEHCSFLMDTCLSFIQRCLICYLTFYICVLKSTQQIISLIFCGLLQPLTQTRGWQPTTLGAVTSSWSRSLCTLGEYNKPVDLQSSHHIHFPCSVTWQTWIAFKLNLVVLMLSIIIIKKDYVTLLAKTEMKTHSWSPTPYSSSDKTARKKGCSSS